MGWGDTDEEGADSFELLRVNVPVVTETNCESRFDLGNDSLPATMFCAGGKENKDSCQGDSGGPIIMEQAEGDVVIGLVSSGLGCGRLVISGFYSKTSIVKDWVLSLAPGAVFV